MSMHRRDFEAIAKALGKSLAAARVEDHKEDETTRADAIEAVIENLVLEIDFVSGPFDTLKFRGQVEDDAAHFAQFL